VAFRRSTKQLRLPLSILTIALAAMGVLSAGEIDGRVRITKALSRKRISLPQVYERTVAIPAATALDDGSLDAELDRVVVYLEGDDQSEPRRAVMNQIRRRFEPEVIAVPAGSTVEFPNNDPIFHNVFSFSKAKQFDLGNYSNGKSRAVTFEHPGIVLLHCHLHPNMSGAVLVTPNGHYARPGKSGEFSLNGVPAGSYTLVAWHKSSGAFRRRVKVSAGGKTSVDIEIPVTEIASK
jgi:plastocyanin